MEIIREETSKTGVFCRRCETRMVIRDNFEERLCRFCEKMEDSEHDLWMELSETPVDQPGPSE